MAKKKNPHVFVFCNPSIQLVTIETNLSSFVGNQLMFLVDGWKFNMTLESENSSLKLVFNFYLLDIF